MQLNILVLFTALLATAQAAPNLVKIDLTLDISDVNVAKDDVCFKICYPEKLKCPKDWYSKQFGECWTCCTDLSASEPGLEASKSFKHAPLRQESSTDMIALKSAAATLTMEICLAVCWPSKPKYATDWYPYESSTGGCWTCCRTPSAGAIEATHHDSQILAVGDSLLSNRINNKQAPLTNQETCLMICLPESPECGEVLYPKLFGYCWTCCTKRNDESMVGLPQNDLDVAVI